MSIVKRVNDVERMIVALSCRKKRKNQATRATETLGRFTPKKLRRHDDEDNDEDEDNVLLERREKGVALPRNISAVLARV